MNQDIIELTQENMDNTMGIIQVKQRINDNKIVSLNNI